MKFESIRVEAYSGYRALERPLAFEYQGRRSEAAEILDRWFEGGRYPKDQKIDYFKIRTHDGHDFLLRYLYLFDSWSVMIEDE